MNRFRALLLVALVLLVTALVVYRPWRPILHGTQAPPAPDRSALAPALAHRIDELSAAVDATPYDAAAWGRLAGVYLVHDLHPEAITCYARAERLDPDDFRWPYFLGLSTFVGDQDAAHAHFERAVALRPEYAPAHVYLGRGCLGRDELDGAERHFTTALRLAPSMLRPSLGLARVALVRDDAERALEHLERVLALGPTESEVHWLLAETHRRLGDDASAERHQALAGARSFPEPVRDPLHQQLGWDAGVTPRWRRVRSGQYLQQERPDLALAEWDAAVAADPDDAIAHAFRGEILGRMGRPGDAIASLRRAVALDPDLALARTLLGSYLLSLGAADEGITHLEAAVAAQAENPEARFNLALALRDLGRRDDAAAHLEEVIAIAPDRHGARIELGAIRTAQGRHDDAVRLLEEVLAAEPDSTMAALRLALALRAADRTDRALEVLRAARERAPDDPQIAQELAWILATAPDERHRDGVRAVDLVEYLCMQTEFRDPFLLDTLAAACAEAGRFDAAILHSSRAHAILLSLPPDPETSALADEILARVDGYRAGRPHRDTPLAEPFGAPAAPVP